MGFNKRQNNIKSSLPRATAFMAAACAILLYAAASTARPDDRPRQQRDSKVYLLHSDIIKKNKTNPDAQILLGNVEFRHDSIYMYCDSACFYKQANSLEAFDNVRMIQGDTLSLTGEYLYYNGNTQIAQMRRNVIMENNGTSLFTDSLNYDRILNYGYYFEGGMLRDSLNTLTSDWGEYSPTTKQAVFNYDVVLENQRFTLYSDTLRYSTATSIATIVGPSKIDNGSNHIYSERGRYDTRRGQACLLDRSLITTDDGKKITADSLFYDRINRYGQAFDDIAFDDTVSRHKMYGDYSYFNDSTNYAFVTDSAVAVDYSQGDSLFLHADTLIAKTHHLGTDSVYREALAYHKVRFYRRDIQGVCDSMVFSSLDSCLTLYHDPILWNGNQQLLGEKIHFYMNDSTLERAHINNSAMSVEKLDSLKYNQVSGKDMKAWFTGGDLRRVDVIGSVRLIYYYMEKDSTYIGMNTSETSLMNMYLKNQQLQKIKMSPKTNSVFYPIDQIPTEKRRLQGFAWFDDIRPRNRHDIFIWRGKSADQQIKQSQRKVPLPNRELFGK